jgi:hypothetical protein
MIVVYDCNMFIIETTGGLHKMGHNRALHNGRLALLEKTLQVINSLALTGFIS